MPADRSLFVRDFLTEYYEHQFVSGLITAREYSRFRAIFASDELERFTAELYARFPEAVEMRGCGVIRLAHLREMDGSEFPFLVTLPEKDALEVPMIVTEYVPDAGTASEIPSDLHGLFRIRYTNYQELFRKLYFGLPNFIAKNRVRSTRKRK